MTKKRIGVLLSGRGSNFEALADSVAAGRIPNAEISIVISNREDALGLRRAGARLIPARVIPSKGLEREAYDRLVVAALHKARVDLVCLAGFMRLLSPLLRRRVSRPDSEYPSVVAAVVPGTRSAAPGARVRREIQRAAPCISWTKISTRGRSWRKRSCPSSRATREETLAARILIEEHRIYTEAVSLVLSGKFRIEGRSVLPSAPLRKVKRINGRSLRPGGPTRPSSRRQFISHVAASISPRGRAARCAAQRRGRNHSRRGVARQARTFAQRRQAAARQARRGSHGARPAPRPYRRAAQAQAFSG